eukprot:CAMPEP_0114293030 /NCGR_PEP_ID=MMETSP0059-20121206/9380_1 /TAXON_ID=36894 /ORGANISM="Pyramimonas parkeae, Strain CCMP726" /LENGTH=98 /DNA_ID=CAMNT_0001414723 /DNA_START=259 /DNA_END=552 /DNA_ORIENTATION=-
MRTWTFDKCQDVEQFHGQLDEAHARHMQLRWRCCRKPSHTLVSWSELSAALMWDAAEEARTCLLPQQHLEAHVEAMRRSSRNPPRSAFSDAVAGPRSW